MRIEEAQAPEEVGSADHVDDEPVRPETVARFRAAGAPAPDPTSTFVRTFPG